DLTGDCKVNVLDLQTFAEQWLKSTEGGSADINGDDNVDMIDLSLLANQWHQAGIPLVINEFMASNSKYPDPQDECDDWIEIYNAGDEDIDIAGMYLIDDLNKPAMWRVPIGNPSLTTIQSHKYLLIWADEDITDAGLHASFKLDTDNGDRIWLFAQDGRTLVDSVVFGMQTTNISYGRYPDGNDGWQFMGIPTPGLANDGTYKGIVSDLKFSHNRGFYDEPFSVTIATDTEGATIRYTVNGEIPNDPMYRWPPGAIYTSPIPINKTTCLRAVALKPGWKPSNLDTNTYIFVSDVITQSPHGEIPGSGWPASNINGQVIDYGMDPDVVNDSQYANLMDDALLAIPTISLVTKLAYLFDPSTGIYVHADQRGRAWERPVSVELINPNGNEGFQINAGLRIRGGYSRWGDNPKHAFRLLFRPEYGQAKLKFPLFGDEGVDEFENIDLRTSMNYSWSFGGDSRNTFVRDEFSRDLQGATGAPYTRSRYCHLYINGQYWGLFDTEERPEAAYGESYFGGNKDDYDVVKVAYGSYNIEATDGTLDAYYRLWQAAAAGFATNEAYYKVQGLNPDGTRNPAYERLVDIDNVINCMLCTFYVGDFDGPISNFLGNNRPNNFYGIYNRINQDGFKYFRHDCEHTLFDISSGWGYDRTGPFPAGQQFQYFNPQWLHQQLVAHPDYRLRVADRAFKYFFNNGPMTPDAAAARIQKWANQIDLAIIAESARWGDAKTHPPLTRNDWLNADQAVNWIINDYLPSRTSTVLNQLKSKGWYPNIDSPTFSHPGGLVPSGFNLSI
ncbi:MAG: CotH kinase family protein, partial [Planctomycetota bacterium]|nr:CotH kinase family protein [Planctomycetota bacterium]